MKKFFLLVAMVCMMILQGCLETVQEITINADGTGTLNTTTDMSAGIAMIKQFAGDKTAELDKMAVDTSIQLGAFSDSIPNLTAAEKAMVSQGSLAMNINPKDEKFIIRLNFPFNKTGDINSLNKLSARIMDEGMKKQMSDQKMAGMGGEAPQMTTMDEYYDIEYGTGVITKKLNKQKHASAQNNEYLTAMKQMSEMGTPMSSTFILNLPRPAKKVEGKNAIASADKKKITIKSTMDDFFDDPAKLEFRIEY